MRTETGTGRFVKNLFLTGCCYLAAVAGADETCQRATETSPRVPWRGYAEAGEEPCWRVEVDAAAVLTLAAVVPLEAPAEPVLDFGGGKVAPVELAADRQVFVVPSSGTFLLRLRSQDPDLPLGPYRVMIDVDRTALTKATEEQEIEPDRRITELVEDVGQVVQAFGDHGVVGAQGGTAQLQGLFHRLPRLVIGAEPQAGPWAACRISRPSRPPAPRSGRRRSSTGAPRA